MDIDTIIHDLIMSCRQLAIDYPDLLPWSQERIDALYSIKCHVDHYEPIASPETQDGISTERNSTGQHFNLPRVNHG